MVVTELLYSPAHCNYFFKPPYKEPIQICLERQKLSEFLLFVYILQNFKRQSFAAEVLLQLHKIYISGSNLVKVNLARACSNK